MRFYCGFSKRLSFKTILKWSLVALGIFGINSCVVHAASFEVIQNWSYCPFNSTSFNSTGCSTTTSSNITTGTINNISNVTKPFTTYFVNQGYSGKEKHTEFFKYGGTGDCPTNDTISFYAELVLDDVNGVLPNNALDYTQYPNSPLLRSEQTRDVTYNNFYQWLANSSSDITNRYGVSVSKSDGTSSSNCSFVSFSNKKSVKFLCSVASGTTGYQIKVNEYNNNGANNTNSALSGGLFVTGVKTTILNDPCVGYSNDQSGVIDSITGGIGGILDGLGGIIDNQNSNSDRQHQDMKELEDQLSDWQEQQHSDNSDIKDKLDVIGGELKEINDNTTSCKKDLFNTNNNKYNNNVGILAANNVVYNSYSNYRYTDYIKLGTKSNLIIRSSNSNNSSAFCLYDSSKILISCTPYNTGTNFNLDVPNAFYIRLTYVLNSWSVELTRCSGMGDYLTGTDIDIGTQLNQTTLPSGNLFMMPINIANKLYNAVSVNSCSPYHIDLDLPSDNHIDLDLPCMDSFYSDNTDLTNIIEAIFSFLLIYGIVMASIKFIERVTSLNDTFDDLYKGGA